MKKINLTIYVVFKVHELLYFEERRDDRCLEK